MDKLDRLDVNYLKECFYYEEETGNLIWKERPLHHFKSEALCFSFNKLYAGKYANSKNVHGYLYVSLNGTRYLVHRIIWKMFYDKLVKLIDHKDRNKENNRIDNLREATSRENVWNSNKQSPNLQYNSKKRKWVVRFHKDKKMIYWKSFKTREEAITERNTKALEIHGQFAIVID